MGVYMKLSDYVFDYCKNIGITNVFMLSGGGIMHLVDSLGRSGINYVCCHHEQAASIAAQAASMYNDSPAVCLVTTGPGGTNAITGCAAAYVDSTPVVFISYNQHTISYYQVIKTLQFICKYLIYSLSLQLFKELIVLNKCNNGINRKNNCRYGG